MLRFVKKCHVCHEHITKAQLRSDCDRCWQLVHRNECSQWYYTRHYGIVGSEKICKECVDECLES